jgi:hypothetical protein
MDRSNRQQDGIGSQGQPGEERGAAWVRPTVTRLSAGSAEDGASTTPDGVPMSPS